MASQRQSNRRLAYGSVAVITLVCTGCSDAVLLTQETEAGGVVSYLFKEERGGPMGSPYRKEALALVEQKCPGGYSVVREGEVKGSGSLSSVAGREGDVIGRHWGIQFRCT